MLFRELNETQTKKLLTEANKPYQTRIDELLIMALAFTLFEMNSVYDRHSENSVIIELENFGRDADMEMVDVTRTVGWFTSLYPVVLTDGSEFANNDMTDRIKLIKEQLRQVPKKGFGFGLLNYRFHELKPLGFKPIRFNYLGDFNFHSMSEYFSVSDFNTGDDKAPQNELSALVEINAMIINKRLQFFFYFNHKNMDKDRLIKLINMYLEQIDAVVHHCTTKQGIEFTPSDFDAAEISEEDLEILTGRR